MSDIRMIWKDKFIAHQVVPAGQLLANPFNFRIHTKQQQAALSGSLDTLQWIAAVKVNTTTGHIVDGHLRVTLALRKGENTGVPVDYYELTEAEEAQALLSLDPIAAMAATDKEQMTALLEQVNSDDEQVQKYMAELAEREGLEWGQTAPGDAEPQIDRAAELQEKWKTERGQLWAIGEHRLLIDDCTIPANVEKVMNGKRAGLMFTDPPFYVGYDYGEEYKDDRDDYPEWTSEWMARAGSIIDNGWIFVMNVTENLEMTLTELSKIARFANLIVWPHGTGAIPSNRFALGWQAIAAYKKGDAFYNNKAQVKESVISDERGGGTNFNGRITDIWADIQPVIAGSRASKEAILQIDSKAKVHHAQMPEALPKRAILFCTKEDDIIYEPFAGSGTTLVASHNLNRKCYAMEISEKYAAVILDRMITAFPSIEIKRL